MSSAPARSPRETSHYLSTQMLAKAHNPWGKSFLLAVAQGGGQLADDGEAGTGAVKKGSGASISR